VTIVVMFGSACAAAMIGATAARHSLTMPGQTSGPVIQRTAPASNQPQSSPRHGLVPLTNGQPGPLAFVAVSTDSVFGFGNAKRPL
jgi:hypothetical protein